MSSRTKPVFKKIVAIQRATPQIRLDLSGMPILGWGSTIVFRGQTYHVSREIGRGTAGKVLELTNVQTDQQAAMKVSKKEAWYLREAEVLAHLDTHAKTTSVGEDTHHCSLPIGTISNKPLFAIMFNLYNGDLVKLLGEQKLSLECIKRFAKDMLGALDFLNKCSVVHADVKPENCLYRYDPKGKVTFVLTDFRISSIIKGDPPDINPHTICTRWYRPPEFSGTEHEKLTPAVDMWSLGAVIAELELKDIPFESKYDESHLQVIRERHHSVIQSITDPNLRDLVARMLEMKPAERISPDVALKHPFLSDQTKKDQK